MKVIKTISLTVVGALLILVAYFSFLQLSGNVHVVIDNQVIRSNQLSAKHLIKVIHRYHLKTIIDMAPRLKQHSQEMKAAKEFNIQHIDIDLSSMHRCPPKKLWKLTQLLMHSLRPMLVHCKAGADRTGLASAIVLILKGDNKRLVQHQYSAWYGAVDPQSTGRATLSPYFVWLKKSNLTTSKLNFLHWVNSQLKVRK